MKVGEEEEEEKPNSRDRHENGRALCKQDELEKDQKIIHSLFFFLWQKRRWILSHSHSNNFITLWFQNSPTAADKSMGWQCLHGRNPRVRLGSWPRRSEL